MKETTCTSNHTCINSADIRKIIKVLIIIVMFMLIELWGHFRTKSLSLLADALHLLVDISGFLVSIATLYIAKRKASYKMTWGYQRIEVLGALLSVILIWVAVCYLMIESFHKYMHPAEIDGRMFLGIAIIGLFVNLGCIYVLHTQSSHGHTHSHQKQNLNIRAAYVHVIGDAIQSVGVIIASTLIYFYPSFVIADVMCTVFFAFLVLISTYYIIVDALIILAEGAPKNINRGEISEFILKEDAVIKITDMRIWSIGVNKHAIVLKILVDNLLIKEYEDLLLKIRGFLETIVDTDMVTVQIDTSRTSNDKTGLVIGGMALSQTHLDAVKG